MPCCVIGALFALQLMAVVRWFKRTVLRQEPAEEDENLWIPQRTKLRDKLKCIFSDPKRRRKIIILFCLEVVLVAVVWLLGGFEAIWHSISAFSQNPDASIEHIPECCTER